MLLTSSSRTSINCVHSELEFNSCLHQSGAGVEGWPCITYVGNPLKTRWKNPCPHTLAFCLPPSMVFHGDDQGLLRVLSKLEVTKACTKHDSTEITHVMDKECDFVMHEKRFECPYASSSEVQKDSWTSI